MSKDKDASHSVNQSRNMNLISSLVSQEIKLTQQVQKLSPKQNFSDAILDKTDEVVQDFDQSYIQQQDSERVHTTTINLKTSKNELIDNILMASEESQKNVDSWLLKSKKTQSYYKHDTLKTFEQEGSKSRGLSSEIMSGGGMRTITEREQDVQIKFRIRCGDEDMVKGQGVVNQITLGQKFLSEPTSQINSIPLSLRNFKSNQQIYQDENNKNKFKYVNTSLVSNPDSPKEKESKAQQNLKSYILLDKQVNLLVPTKYECPQILSQQNQSKIIKQKKKPALNQRMVNTTNTRSKTTTAHKITIANIINNEYSRTDAACQNETMASCPESQVSARPNTVQGKQLYILSKQSEKDITSTQIYSQQIDLLQEKVDKKNQKLRMNENRNIYSEQNERPVTEMQKSLGDKQFKKTLNCRISQIISMDNGRNEKNNSVTFEQTRKKNQQSSPESPLSSVKLIEGIKSKNLFEIKKGVDTLEALSQEQLYDSNLATKRTKINHSFIRQNSKDNTYTLSNSKADLVDNIDISQRKSNKPQPTPVEQVHQKKKNINILPVVCPKVADLSKQFKQIQFQHKNMIQNTWYKKPSSKSQGRTKQNYFSRTQNLSLSDYQTLDQKMFDTNENMFIKYQAAQNQSDNETQIIVRLSMDQNNKLQVIKETQFEHETKQFYTNIQKVKQMEGIDLKLIQMPIDLSSAIHVQRSFMPQNNNKLNPPKPVTPIIIPHSQHRSRISNELSPKMKQISLIKVFGNRRVSFKEWLHPKQQIMQDGSLSSQSKSRNFDSTMYNELYQSDQNSQLSPTEFTNQKRKNQIMAQLMENSCGLVISSVRQTEQKAVEVQLCPVQQVMKQDEMLINDCAVSHESTLEMKKGTGFHTDPDEIFQKGQKPTKTLTSSGQEKPLRKSYETANSLNESSFVQSNKFNLLERSLNIETVITRSLLNDNEKDKKSSVLENDQINGKSTYEDPKLLMSAFSFRNGPNVLYVDNILPRNQASPPMTIESPLPPSSLSINVQNRQVAYQKLRAIHSRLQSKIVDISKVKKVKKLIKSDRQTATADSYSYRSPKCNATESQSINDEYLKETQIKRQVYQTIRSVQKSDRFGDAVVNHKKIKLERILDNEQDIANQRITTKDIFDQTNQQTDQSVDTNKMKTAINSKGQDFYVSLKAMTSKLNTAKFTDKGSHDITLRIEEIRMSDDYKQIAIHQNLKPQINTTQHSLLKPNQDLPEQITQQPKPIQPHNKNYPLDLSCSFKINQASIKPKLKKNKFEKNLIQDYKDEEFLKSQILGIHHNKMKVEKRNPPVFGGGFIEGMPNKVVRPVTKGVEGRATSYTASCYSSLQASTQFREKGLQQNGGDGYQSLVTPGSIMSKKSRGKMNADVVSMSDIEQYQQRGFTLDQLGQQITNMSFNNSKQQFYLANQIQYNENEQPLVSRFTQGMVKSSQDKTREDQKIKILSNLQNYKNSIQALEAVQQKTILLDEPFTNSPQISKHIQDFQRYHKINLYQIKSERHIEKEIQQELEKQIGFSNTNETAKNQGTNVLSMDSIDILGQNKSNAIQMNLHKRRCLSQMKKPTQYKVDDKPLDPFLVDIIHLKTLYIMQEELWQTYENEWSRFQDQNSFQVKAPVPINCRTLVFHIYLQSLQETLNLPQKKNFMVLDLDSFDFNLYQQAHVNAKRRLQFCVFRVLDPNSFNYMKEELQDGYQSIAKYEKLKQLSLQTQTFSPLLFQANTLSQQDGINVDGIMSYSKNVTDLKNCMNSN